MHVFGPLVQSWVRKAGLQAHDADDLTQQVFSAAAKGIAQYQDSREIPHTFRRWLWGITRNHVIDFHKDREKQPQAVGGTKANLRMQQMPIDPFEEANAEDKKSVFLNLARRAMELLKTDFEPLTWQMFHRTVINGEPTTQVAEELGVSTKVIRQARYRVLKRLREELGDDLPATD
jgi:RNA polymerase sigma-70 factor (ECF subfamily)